MPCLHAVHPGADFSPSPATLAQRSPPLVRFALIPFPGGAESPNEAEPQTINALSHSDEKTFMKLICVGEEERVVGIHLLGREVDEMMQGFAVALKLGVRKRDLEATVAIHPSAAEEVILMCGPARGYSAKQNLVIEAK